VYLIISFLIHILKKVFGATGLIGRSLTKCILSRGDKLTAVGRLYEHFLEEMQNWHDNCQGLLCDVRVKETVDAVIENSISHWGSIDIIVKFVNSFYTLHKCL